MTAPNPTPPAAAPPVAPAAAPAEPSVAAAIGRALHALIRSLDVRTPADLGDALAARGADPSDIATITAHLAAHPPGS
jgi:hypothetical protein